MDNLSKETVPQIFMQKKLKKYNKNFFLDLCVCPTFANFNSSVTLLLVFSFCAKLTFAFLNGTKLTFVLSFRIGIRSDDLKDFIERSVKGSSMALSSPRLVIPAAIYGLWVLSHQHFVSDLFDFQVALKTIVCLVELFSETI